MSTPTDDTRTDTVTDAATVDAAPTSGTLVEAVHRAVKDALRETDARDREEKSQEKAIAERKEHLTARVSIAAICLTMLMSFLGFVRAERADASGGATQEADKARSDAEARWAYYQMRVTERASLQVADDNLARATESLRDDDPRVALAAVDHADYITRIANIDNANRQVFFVVQDLERQQVNARRRAARISRTVDRYDMGTRVLTLAVVLLSVTLLANRRALFWVGVGVAAIGAAIAINGYFLFY